MFSTTGNTLKKTAKTQQSNHRAKTEDYRIGCNTLRILANDAKQTFEEIDLCGRVFFKNVVQEHQRANLKVREVRARKQFSASNAVGCVQRAKTPERVCALSANFEFRISNFEFREKVTREACRKMALCERQILDDLLVCIHAAIALDQRFAVDFKNNATKRKQIRKRIEFLREHKLRC
jgi:hypothetical protein